ncbi:hypothetical protein CCR75_009370 [Bremia lactucae]|uniref:GRIP domain-containing protein n=1 Tax=Bremia lactucae TaxID=4779 RepID=A0A976IH61_BRELC|nr:hypothetical protein CCR75_009370 [Bremia lactucae]
MKGYVVRISVTINLNMSYSNLNLSIVHSTAINATQCQTHEEALVLMRKQLEELKAANETLQEHERVAHSRAAEYEQGYMTLLTEMETLKTTNEIKMATLLANKDEHACSIASQQIYDLEAQLATSEADKAVAQKDAERLQKDLNALEGVLHRFQMNSKVQKERVAAMEAALERAKQELQSQQAILEPSEGIANDYQRVLAKLAEKTRECEQLREALESSTMQYYSDREVLDKRLAAQLVVAYISRVQKSDVLHLMARMMDFTEEQKSRVGLCHPIEGNGGGGLISSILEFVAPEENAQAAVDPSTIGDKSFAEMLSEFLVDEAAKGK